MNKYNKIGFVNGSAPALNADNLNHMDEGIEQATDGAIALETETTRDAGVDVPGHAARGYRPELRALSADEAAGRNSAHAFEIAENVDLHDPTCMIFLIPSKMICEASAAR